MNSSILSKINTTFGGVYFSFAYWLGFLKFPWMNKQLTFNPLELY